MKLNHLWIALAFFFAGLALALILPSSFPLPWGVLFASAFVAVGFFCLRELWRFFAFLLPPIWDEMFGGKTEKWALCIAYSLAGVDIQRVKEAARLPIHSRFFGTPTYLLPRSECETDEDYLQLLPYITLYDAGGRFFCYVRGKAGEEGRLHDLLSVGLGGHVDSVPPRETMLYSHLQAEAARELKEEAGIVVTDPIKFDSLLVVRSDIVNRVHLGVHGSYRLLEGEEKKMVAETGVIESGRFVALDDLMLDYERLEPWSQLVVRHELELRHEAQISYNEALRAARRPTQ